MHKPTEALCKGEVLRVVEMTGGSVVCGDHGSGSAKGGVSIRRIFDLPGPFLHPRANGNCPMSG